jgi:uncharacterized membrane protein
MPMLWLCFMGVAVMVLLTAIVYGVKAGRGEWAEYPMLGQIARRSLSSDPEASPDNAQRSSIRHSC